MTRPLIGISARAIAADPAARGSSRRHQWSVEAELSGAVQRLGALPVVLPVPDPAQAESFAADYVSRIDALLLQGGSDIAPSRWGEQALRAQWAGDRQRDAFEFAMFACARARGLPILGICRGLQVINVALGGSLFQDLAATNRANVLHDDPARYDAHRHRVALTPGGLLREVFGVDAGLVSSAHHQAIARLSPGLRIEAVADDGSIEAVRGSGEPWLVGVQWHPEFHLEGRGELAGNALLKAFVQCVVPARAGQTRRD